MKRGKKHSPTRPPVAAIARACPSVTLRTCWCSASAFECVAAIGPSASSSTSATPGGARCETSISIPSRPSSRTRSRPNGVRPPGLATPTPSAASLRGFQVRPSERTPRPCSSCSRSRRPRSGFAPSRCRTRPRSPAARAAGATAASRSATERTMRSAAQAAASPSTSAIISFARRSGRPSPSHDTGISPPTVISETATPPSRQRPSQSAASGSRSPARWRRHRSSGTSACSSTTGRAACRERARSSMPG